MTSSVRALIVAALVALTACGGAGARHRPLALTSDGRWLGAGVCYGPHRDGQRPGGAAPTTAELREDLQLLAPRWGLIRIYGAVDPAPRILEVIRGDRLPLTVLLGVWIAPDAAAANQGEVDAAIALANAYPDVVIAVVVGNETQVSWSDHRVPLDELIGYVRAVRRATTVPVTVADDFAAWLDPAIAPLVPELDAIVLHVHPMWNGQQLDDALAFTQGKYREVVARHPRVPVILGEAGWATQRHDEGEQATLIKGAAGEAEQRVFFDAFTAWVTDARIPSTYFEAFDENWKGGPHPDEVEKHWGLYRADRTPKAAVADPEPERHPKARPLVG
ncbi:MAG: glycosyl hydrolase family 17 [Myxococcales bacterium]|nr:glycosyl hydrolase family 17 [Myxococcales bacterium]